MTRRVILGLLVLGACTRTTTEMPVTPAPSPATPVPVIVNGPRPAVEAFMSAVKAQDLQAMDASWGDKNGAVRDSKVMSREDREQRELVLMRCLKHDKFRIIGEGPAADGERVLQVELTTGTLMRIADFYTAKASDRWYLRYVQPLCPAK